MLPRLREAVRKTPDEVAHLADCDHCMRRHGRATRQLLRCGWEVPVESSSVWQPADYVGPEPTVCPGYTTKLPEVLETAEAKFYLDKGSLGLLVHDEIADGLRDAIAILDTAEAKD